MVCPLPQSPTDWGDETEYSVHARNELTKSCKMRRLLTDLSTGLAPLMIERLHCRRTDQQSTSQSSEEHAGIAGHRS